MRAMWVNSWAAMLVKITAASRIIIIYGEIFGQHNKCTHARNFAFAHSQIDPLRMILVVGKCAESRSTFSIYLYFSFSAFNDCARARYAFFVLSKSFCVSIIDLGQRCAIYSLNFDFIFDLLSLRWFFFFTFFFAEIFFDLRSIVVVSIAHLETASWPSINSRYLSLCEQCSEFWMSWECAML